MKMYEEEEEEEEEEEDDDDDDDDQNGDGSSLEGGTWNFSCSLININLSRISRLSPYRAVNTLPLGYTNQSVNVV